jgi:cytochrome c-type biogenesis protein CcmH
MNRIAILLLPLLLLTGTLLQAGTTLESYKFEHHADELRFRQLASELRCLVCQNQSLADSDAELAHDLRNEVYEMMVAGKTNQQITDFLVDRYGDFVLYKPPVKPSTWLIWFGPFAVLLVALLLLVRAVRRQRVVPQTEISAAERQRLQQVLNQTEGSDNKA